MATWVWLRNLEEVCRWIERIDTKLCIDMDERVYCDIWAKSVR